VFGEHPDVQAVDEDHHPRAPEGPAQPDVVEPAPVADGDGAVLVDAGVADPDLSADPSFGPVRPGLGPGPAARFFREAPSSHLVLPLWVERFGDLSLARREPGDHQ
jgi:hypothetical protein